LRGENLRDAPEIVKILQEEEKLGLLDFKSQSSSEELYSSKIPSDSQTYKSTDKKIRKINHKDSYENLKVYQRKIEEQIKQLKKLDKIKSNFLNITSHELRTPISAIKGYLQMILKQKLGDITEEQKKSLEIALRNANRLDNLIQDILDLSRLDSGRMRFILEKTNIKTMIAETVETMQTIADKKHIRINAKIDDFLPDLIIDGERIKQVIINLINNAIKFSSEDSDINININKEQKEIIFEVQDFGRGIPSDQKDVIFDAFYQVKSNEDKKLGGVGLGLAISRGIILAHGGNIWVDSIENNGSKFTFTLPIKSVRNIEDRLKDVDVFRVEE
jgi:signal transduction histidine kinase